MTQSVKVTLLAWSRELGGAERQLVNLACGLRRRGHDVLVVVFFPNRYVEASLRETGTPFRVLGVRGRWDAYRYLVRFLAEALTRDSHVVYAFLQVPNLLTVPLKLLRRKARVVWGIRTSDFRTRSNALSGLVTWLESRLSRVADVIIANSFHGRDDAVALGFDRNAITVIHNGIDTEAFRPDPDAGTGIRAEWGIAAFETVIGLVGRFEAKKDHDTFLRAAAIAALERADLRFVCVGDRPASARAGLEAQAGKLGLDDRVIWAGFRQDMSAVYCALDVATLTSAFGEGFPNVVAEAMACGVPCVVTDVGDAALILGDLGWIVPPRNPRALADAWIAALAQDRRPGIRERRRRRIEENYNLELMIDRTEQALSALFEQKS
ncbi:Putative glycosyltransferase EpsF [Burkholderiales bacterium]|nr:Putative glycosyltransferase EpsF [Burkholderiales bacterium]